MEPSVRSKAVPEGHSATVGADPQPGARRASPQRVTRVLLLAAILGICDQNYWQYSNVDHYFSGHWMQFVNGTGAAPEQYRIGVKLTAWWLVKHLGWSFRYGYTLIDVIASVIGALLVYDLLQRRPAIRRANAAVQWFVSAGFLALLCYYLLWQGFFFRPETLPSLGFTACMAWLWTVPRTTRRGTVLTICGLLAAAAAQAWVRADLPCALNAGIFLACLAGSGRGLSLSKRAALVTSLVSIGIAAGIQLYIMRVLYPQANYAKTPLFMLAHDWHQPLTFPPFLVYMLPVAWTAVQVWRQRAVLDTGSKGLALGAAIYFVLWIVLGKLDEVRIFFPFAVILIPLTMELAARWIATGTTAFGKMGSEVEA